MTTTRESNRRLMTRNGISLRPSGGTTQVVAGIGMRGGAKTISVPLPSGMVAEIVCRELRRIHAEGAKLTMRQKTDRVIGALHIPTMPSRCLSGRGYHGPLGNESALRVQIRGGEWRTLYRCEETAHEWQCTEDPLPRTYRHLRDALAKMRQRATDVALGKSWARVTP